VTENSRKPKVDFYKRWLKEKNDKLLVTAYPDANSEPASPVQVLPGEKTEMDVFEANVSLLSAFREANSFMELLRQNNAYLVEER
jgi:hypothetical protein